MRKLSINALKPEMVVGRPVINADGLVLLNRGTVLTNRYIGRLFSLGIPAVYIEDQFLPDDVDAPDVISDQTRLLANKTVKDLMMGLEEQAQAGAQPKISHPNKIINTVKNVVQNLLQNGNIMVNLTDIRSLDDYTFGHSVNVCVLSLLTGVALGYSQQALLELGMGAMLHDIGKTRVDPEILNKAGSLSKEEFEEIKKHTIYGYEMLLNLPDISNASRLVACQHHEKYDGRGYPQGLKSKEIHEFARITGMVDIYDALTADRVYRKAYQPHEAFEMIAGTGDFLFEYRLVKAFLLNVALYPVGTLLYLHTGEIAVVLSTPRGFSHRPAVRVLYDAKGNLLDKPYEIKLAENHSVLVSRTLTEGEYSKLYNEYGGQS